jgi:transcriptional regulator with XRE-family HTH domain
MSRRRLEPIDPAERERVGQTLRTMREMRGMRQAELADAMGVHRTYVVAIEAGRKRLTPIMLARAAAALHVEQIALMAERAA